jgi:hypothetical protein
LSGGTHTQCLGPVLPHCDYDLFLGSRPQEVQVDKARFCLDITATLGNDGKTQLKFTPKVETGEQVLPFQPAPDQSNWVYKVERPSKAYPDLSWEVGLPSNRYLVIGAQLGQPTSLGCRALVNEDGPTPVQRLLVIRTARKQQTAEDEPTLHDLARSSASPPLALQATLGTVRASRP